MQYYQCRVCTILHTKRTIPITLKAGGYTVAQWLKDIFDIAWKCGKTPQEWREAVIVPIYKKGNREECGNYRRDRYEEGVWTRFLKCEGD